MDAVNVVFEYFTCSLLGIFMSEMDYSKFTLQELYDIYRTIDNDAEPEKAKILFKEIEKKEKEKAGPFEGKLATRGLRLIAFLVDLGIVWIISTFAFRFLYGSFFTIDFRRIFSADGQYLEFLFFILVGFTILVYFLVNGYYLYKYGQTVGKKIIGIKITDKEGNVPPLSKTYLVRYFIPAVVSSFPVFGIIIWFVDVIFIFGKNKKCLHDHIADTKVVFVGDEIYF